MEKQKATLENWSIDGVQDIAYGNVFGHPKIPDGTYIRTSLIVDIDRDGENIIVETLNTFYTLKRGYGLVGGKN